MLSVSKRTVALSIMSCILCTPPAFAASQGTLGATSTGSALITITKSKQAQISDISDMTLSNWVIGNGAVTLRSNICVYSSTGSYTVTASGSGTASIFTVGTSPTNVIPYTVTWNSGGAGSLADTGTALVPTIASTNLSNASTTSANCNGGGSTNDTARVVVGITQANMDAAASSATPYTGTLTLVITPY